MLKIDFTYYKKDINYNTYMNQENEQKIFHYIENNDKDSFYKILESDKEADVFLTLCDINSNILKWYSFKENSSILELGDPFGIFTETLCQKVTRVTCLEFNKKMANCVLKRNFLQNNLKIFCGDIKDVAFKERFDYITIFGNLDFIESIFPEGIENLFIYIKDNLLSENGTILFATDNKLGMENLLKADFAIENVKKAKLYKNELEEVFKKSCFQYYKFYYPLPNYKIVSAIYTDSYLPNTENILFYRPYYSDKELILHDEIEKYRELIKCNKSLFPYFANSFFVEMSQDKIPTNIKFVKFNNKRKKKYRLITKLNGQIFEKIAENPKAEQHIESMIKNMNNFSYGEFELYDSIGDKKIISKYIDNLQTLNYFINDYKSAIEYLDTMKNMLESQATTYHNQNVFIKYMPEISDNEYDQIESLKYVKDGFWDGILSNAFLLNGKTYLFDQEWMDHYVPIKYILFRCIMCDINVYRQNKNGALYDRYEITPYIDLFYKLENNIQKEIMNTVNVEFLERKTKTLFELIKYYEETISEQKFYLKEKDDHIKGLNIIIEDLRNSFEIIKKQKNELEEINKGIINSKSWKYTQIFRKNKKKER